MHLVRGNTHGRHPMPHITDTCHIYTDQNTNTHKVWECVGGGYYVEVDGPDGSYDADLGSEGALKEYIGENNLTYVGTEV